jgi:hypothetical protein
MRYSIEAPRISRRIFHKISCDIPLDA